MANLSQQKRQRMLEFLQTIREEHKDDDDVLIALGEIESELNAKKYGLVWCLCRRILSYNSRQKMSFISR